MSTFKIKTEIQFGKEPFNCLKVYGNKKVFIVTDPYMVKSGLINKVTEHLVEGNYYVFSDVVPDPPIAVIVSGVQQLLQYEPEIMIALGGGSAIDAAKAITHFSKEISSKNEIKLIAIPTTSGTGSEVTSFSVITDETKGRKYPLVSDALLPDMAILDLELVKTVPSAIVADTGLDVLTHAIEAYVSTAASDFSDALAEKAIQLVFQYLKRSFGSMEDLEAKEKMHHASCIAGLAFNEASLGLNHALAHTLGGRFHLPHGRLNAILLPHVIEFNASIKGYSMSNYNLAAKKYANLARLVGIQGSNVRMLVKNLIQEIIKLRKECHVPSHLQECGISLDDINQGKKEIAKGTLEDRCMDTNPVKATENDIFEILHQISH